MTFRPSWMACRQPEQPLQPHSGLPQLRRRRLPGGTGPQRRLRRLPLPTVTQTGAAEQGATRTQTGWAARGAGLTCHTFVRRPGGAPTIQRGRWGLAPSKSVGQLRAPSRPLFLCHLAGLGENP